MAWVRIHDGAMGNLKIVSLSDSAFRLWVKGLCYCQTNLTDGLIPRAALRDMGAKRKDVEALSTSQVPGRAPLWEHHDVGFKVHDYLVWNDCRDKVVERQERARQRKDDWQERRRQARENASRTREGTRSEHDSGSHTTKPNQTKPTSPSDSQQKNGGVTARSRKPIYQSDRFAVFEWQLDDLCQMLGPHVDSFDLHGFFDDLSRRSRDQGLVIPADRGARWRWLQGQVEAEAKRRGLPMAGAMPASSTESLAEGVRDILRKQGAIS